MRILQALLTLYLRRYPNRLRLSQFNFLARYGWLKNALEEIRPALFPKQKEEETVAEATPEEPPSDEVIQILASEIRGRRGHYRVEQWRYRRGQGYVFSGTQLGLDQPVVIKEYLLNASFFNEQELRQRQQVFENLAGLELADGRLQDLRVIQPLEAIADADAAHRCYLVTDSRDAAPTLRQQIAVIGARDSEAVRQLLLQLLQTLELLHQQKFRLPSGQIQQGIVHGKLSLDSVLWVDYGSRVYLYLTDLLLWEALFAYPVVQASTPSVAKDLAAVGHIGLDLLLGTPYHNADPRDDESWGDTHPLLKAVLRQLMGLAPPFVSAAEARQALLHIPALEAVSPTLQDLDAATVRRRRSPWLVTLLIFAAVGLLLALLWGVFNRDPLSARAPTAPSPCCFEEIDAMPSGTFTYTYVEDGSWRYLLEQRSLLRRAWSLSDHFKAAYPDLALNAVPSGSIDEAIAQVQAGTVDFAVVPQINPIPFELNRETLAYDGLAIFVAFSYSRRSRGLPTALDGTLTLNQLQQIYREDIDTWRFLSDSRLPIKRYASASPESRELFEHFVLDGFTLDDLVSVPIETNSTLEILRSIIRDFERPQVSGPVGSVGFSSLSMVFGQCSVYPLAIQANGDRAVQPLTLTNGEAIDPNTDLCDRKGSYAPDIEAFRLGTYPLAYPLVVVFPRDNSLPPIGEKFAQALRTIEGQRFLKEAGFAPLDEIPEGR